jgi:hypothetical protein
MLLDVGKPSSNVCDSRLAPVRDSPNQHGRPRLTVERPLVCDIINQENAHCASVVGSGDRPEPLLSGCIPYLQLHTLAIQFNCADFEVDTDRGDEGWCERVLTEAEKAARFTHPGISDEQQLNLYGNMSTIRRWL